LDENLLLDALFGHVKGAFSEAKAERKGAFQAASGGTLHLDEIGNASPKVQQALLRALSVRRIRPLGSDQDIPFDARIIAATNVDLLECAKNGAFREDLYYRLAVITINTPPLRQRKEDLPALVRFFLKETAVAQNKKIIELSRGALDKILQYDWPGNIRELKNCITRAVTFAEGDILLADHINLGVGPEPIAQPETPPPSVIPPTTPEMPMISEEPALSQPPRSDPAPAMTEPESLNPRQKKAWPAILAAGGTNRASYQNILGEEISVRTAQYDLQDMVNKGLLIKSGKGPSLKYVVASLP
jgi:two-component system response regulator HydG